MSLHAEICKRCGKAKDASQFFKRLGTGKQLKKRMCIDCRAIAEKESHTRWLTANPEREKELQRNHYLKYNERRRKQWREDPKHRERNLEACARYYEKNRDFLVEKAKLEHRQRRIELIKLYGGKCECCAEKNWEFLAIDHINGGGNKERNQIGDHAYYKKIFCGKRLFGYQILCHNCNMAKGLYGYCPHEKIKCDVP